MRARGFALALAFLLIGGIAAAQDPRDEFRPRPAADDWWVVRVERWSDQGAVIHACCLLYYVLEVRENTATIAVASTWRWGWQVQVDLPAFTPRTVTPALLDTSTGRVRVRTERQKDYSLPAGTAGVVFPEYAIVDPQVVGFPPADGAAAVLCTITEAEAPGEQSATGAVPLATQATHADGALRVEHTAELPSGPFRLMTTWRPGLPYLESGEFSHAWVRGAMRLVAHGSRGQEVLIPKTVGMPSIPIPPRGNKPEKAPAPPKSVVTRLPATERFLQPLVEAAIAELGGGAEPAAAPGKETAFRRGDFLHVAWRLQYLPTKQPTATASPPGETVRLPPAGNFAVRVQDLRRVGGEDLVFLVTPGEDDREYSFRGFHYGVTAGARAIWDLIGGRGCGLFRSPEWWQPSPDSKTWEWARVRNLRRLSATDVDRGDYLSAAGRRPTWWVIVLRAQDLSLRAVFGAPIDHHLGVEPLAVKILHLPDAPVYLSQGSQLLRPIDWLVTGGWAAFGRTAEDGSLCRLSQSSPEPFTVAVEAGVRIEQAVVGNPNFFAALTEQLAKKRAPGAPASILKLQPQDLPALERSASSTPPPVTRLRDLEAGKPVRPVIVRVGYPQGFHTYLGFEPGYPFWSRAAVVHFNGEYLAFLDALPLVPIPAAPGGGASAEITPPDRSPLPPEPDPTPKPPRKTTEGSSGNKPPPDRDPPAPEGPEVPVGTGS